LRSFPVWGTIEGELFDATSCQNWPRGLDLAGFRIPVNTMATEATSPAVPKAPFVIVTRKGGFPAATLAEACRLVRPLVTDGRAAVTDSAGHRFAPREFLKAAEAKELASAVVQVEEPALCDWASKTSDLDLEEGPPPGWLMAAPEAAAPKAPRSSDRHLGRHPRLGRPISDRRPSNRSPAGATANSSGLILVVLGLVVVGAIIAWLSIRAPVPKTLPAATTAPRNVAPPPAPVPEPRMRLEDRPLPT